MAATAPQIDMAMIGRVLASAKKSKAQVLVSERQRLASLTARQQTGPVPTPGLIRRDDESDAELIDRWAEIVGALPDPLQVVINLEAEGLDMTEIAEELGVPLVTVWDRALEATAAILEAAGLPVVNRWLEAKLKGAGLLPSGARPFPCDLGWMVRHLYRRMRETAYARISCRNVDVPAVWGVKVPTFNNRLSILKRILRRYAIAAGALPVPPNTELVCIWVVADSVFIGNSSPDLYTAVDRAGLPLKDRYTWSEARLIWDALVGSAAYRGML